MKIQKPSFALFQWIYWLTLLVTEVLFLVATSNMVPDKGPSNVLQLFIVAMAVVTPVGGIILGAFIANGDAFTNWYAPRYSHEDEQTVTISDFFRLRNLIKWGIIVFLTVGIVKLCVHTGRDFIKVYNTSQKLSFAFQQKTQEKAGFYDKLWKTYLQKEKITNLNKEVFVQVTKIIMENRRDGQGIAWKWLQENQQIPYSEFVKFYADLSNFIESQREDYYQIEVACQKIVCAQNTLIDTFPNNLYNRVLNIKPLQFRYGILSDSTNNVIKTTNNVTETGVENLK